MNRRHFLKSSLVAACGTRSVVRSLAEVANASELDKMIFGAPLTHSDWMLKAGIPWGEAGVRHMLDACKACGWSRVYWRALDGGRSLYKSRLMRPQGRWDDDSYWDPKEAGDKQLAQRFTGNMPAEKRAAIREQLYALDYAHFDSLGA